MGKREGDGQPLDKSIKRLCSGIVQRVRGRGWNSGDSVYCELQLKMRASYLSVGSLITSSLRINGANCPAKFADSVFRAIDERKEFIICFLRQREVVGGIG